MTTPFGNDPGEAEAVLARLRERGFASEADSLAGWLASDLPEAVALEADAVSTVPLSSAERLRRGWMIAFAVAWVVLLLSNVACVLTLSQADALLVGALLATAQSVVAGFFGASVAYYFAVRG